jgi:hypothetical protein
MRITTKLLFLKVHQLTRGDSSILNKEEYPNENIQKTA